MFRTVELPLWLLILILAFAAVTALSHFLLPSVRWFFRRRMERVVAKLNTRLQRPIEPFKLLRRQDTIQRLIYDPKVAQAVAEHASETGVREDVAFQEAHRYAREIVPSFSATAYFGFATRAAKLLSRAIYRVRLGHFDEEAVSAISSDATVVFVMNHRSNMDYVLVTYLAGETSALSYAVGEWAHVWPLSGLIRAMGAYFIRRKSRNLLYRRVLARYVQMATRAGVAQAVFPEGSLSLNGKVRDPKLGLLNYIISDFVAGDGRDVVFVPVALNYDRVLEDRVLLAAAASSKRKFRFRWRDAIRYFLKHLYQRLSGRFIRFGYAAVNFGAPLSLAQFPIKQSSDRTKQIGKELMRRIRAITPVLPVPLVATCLLENDGILKREELKKLVRGKVRALEAGGVPVPLLKQDVDQEIDAAINHLLMRQIINETPSGIVICEPEKPLLEYYAASISQHSDVKKITH
ncbi:MAG: 1-acyl-sn-glycerol-3-phosphate acyltransferase [Marinosulfonomonas sp.]|nr:1-acyl-sn-glycerol-3-phosphate acyltransferase [Marinosulfonomonas sp.]